MQNQLFVYGSLAPGKSNAHMLSEQQGTWRPGTVRGKLIPSGWGNAMGFPGVQLQNDGEQVPGLLFCSDDLKEYWPVLDAFEGKEYQRVTTTVLLDDGSSTEAFIYELLPEQEHERPVTL